MEMNVNGESGIYVLPEGCIADVISLITPPDACQISLVSKLFHSASESDAVWEKFLPSDYRNMIARSINPSSLPDFSSTKQLYLHLSDHPLIIDGGNKSFSLEKRSGKKCYMLSPRSLKLVWGDTQPKWTWTSLPDTRFEEVAEIKMVWSLDIHGNISTCLLSRDTNYAAYIVYKFIDNKFGSELANLSRRCLAAVVSVGVIGEESKAQFAILEPEPISEIVTSEQSRDANWIRPKEREDGWLELELGQFFNKSEEDTELNMILKERRLAREKEALLFKELRSDQRRVNKRA